MAESLSAFAETRLYLDAMLLVGFVDDLSPWHPSARHLFARAVQPGSQITLYTAALALDEATFILLEETVARPPYSVTRSRSQFLSRHPEVVRDLMRILGPLVQSVGELLTLEAVIPEDIVTMRQEMAATGLLPRDAIHVAVMRRLGITAMASDDDAFERCADIRLFKP